MPPEAQCSNWSECSERVKTEPRDYLYFVRYHRHSFNRKLFPHSQLPSTWRFHRKCMCTEQLRTHNVIILNHNHDNDHYSWQSQFITKVYINKTFFSFPRCITATFSHYRNSFIQFFRPSFVYTLLSSSFLSLYSLFAFSVQGIRDWIAMRRTQGQITTFELHTSCVWIEPFHMKT